MSVLVHRERIEQTILLIRGHRVILDADLAKLYGVTTFNLNKAVKRNTDRFPEDFMFRLSAQEAAALTFQIGISKPRGERRSPILALRIHGTRCRDAVQCVAKQARDPSEHCHYASIRKAARTGSEP